MIQPEHTLPANSYKSRVVKSITSRVIQDDHENIQAFPFNKYNNQTQLIYMSPKISYEIRRMLCTVSPFKIKTFYKDFHSYIT
jgi:hypothetical protein